jgi:Tat protein secretion system quality control protein TatD with DNase activity
MAHDSAIMPGGVSWYSQGESTKRLIAYRGQIGSGLRLRYGFDGWREPIDEIRLDQVNENLAVAEINGLDGHLAIDCAVLNGERWDNNCGVDYRLWIGFDALDAHLHVSGRGGGALGLSALTTAMASAGIVAGVSSWIENRALDDVDSAQSKLFPLVWIRPGDTDPDDVRRRLVEGAVGLKLHPTVDEYRADDSELDRYLDIAAQAGVPVACHSAPGDADPDHIRRLAQRFSNVPIILYHTFLGAYEGRERAVEHVREQSNLYLETSWCRWEFVRHMIDTVGADRVLFGSDASIDGASHYLRNPPNVEGTQTYNRGLISLIGQLDPKAARKVMGDNARRLFKLNGNSH